MLSIKSCIELISVIEHRFNDTEIDRIFFVFNLEHLIFPSDPRQTKPKKVNRLLGYLKTPSIKGPFTESFQMDLLSYLVDSYYRELERTKPFIHSLSSDYKNMLSMEYKLLSNSLKRDGYLIEGAIIRKALPVEIQEAKIESELILLLNSFQFSQTKGHFQQAVDNHTRNQWAGANSQFRVFVESLLIEIANKLLPSNKCSTAASAISLLGNTVSPPFLRAELNEVSHPRLDIPFIEALWKRLHPEGAHPGLSGEEDSTFRYHMVVVFAHNLLQRLQKRNAL